jgi:hypothetical protein
MKAKKFIVVSMLLALVGLLGGCHWDGHDDYRYGSGYGTYRGASGTYRDGFRDGRAYERRNDNWRDSRNDDRGPWWRRW